MILTAGTGSSPRSQSSSSTDVVPPGNRSLRPLLTLTPVFPTNYSFDLALSASGRYLSGDRSSHQPITGDDYGHRQGSETNPSFASISPLSLEIRSQT
mmetsp:Transcript_2240/g.5035  ORF Transcript_2240/g.5035 Transcript_2240/m.5035 type:complete len:98 (-) Transcript_2240:2536-2829(-)